MAEYNTEVRIHAEMDNKQAKKGAEEIEESLDKAAKKAEEKIEIGVEWDEKAQKEAEENIDRILQKKRELAEESATVEVDIEEPRTAEINWGKSAEETARINAEIDKIAANMDHVSEKEDKAAEKLKAQEAAAKELEGIRLRAVVENQDLVNLMQEQETITARMAQLKKAGVADGYQEYEELRERLAEINEEIQYQRQGFSAMEDSGRRACETISKSVKKTNGLLGMMRSRLRGIALSLLAFNQIRKGFNALVSAMQEGFKNLAQYSEDYNAQMSALQSSSAELKNSMAAAFEPIVNMAIPYLVQLINWLTKAADTVAQFAAALRGKSTYTKAKKQVIDYAKSLDTATKSAKRALAAFDELNVLNQKDAGISTGREATGADAFETGTVSGQVSGFASEILAAIQPFKDAIRDWWQDIDFEPLLSSFEKLKESCDPFAGYLLDGMLWFLENVLLPLGSWTIQDAAPAFFDLLSAALEAFDVVLQALQPYGIWLWDNLLQPLAKWTGNAAIDGMKFLTEKLRAFSDWCKADKANVDNMAHIVIGFLSGIITYYAVKKVVSAIGRISDALNVFKGAAAALSSPVGLAATAIGTLTFCILEISKNWSKLDGGQKAAVVMGGLAAAVLAAAVAFAVFHTCATVGIAAAAIIGGLAALGISTAILSSSGGSKTARGSSHSAQEFYDASQYRRSPIPQLADGAVIQGGRPFAAILGDQPSGQTNIETPLATMVEAFKIAQAETGGGGQYTFVAQLDGREIYREVVRRDQMHADKTGSSAFLT